MKQTLQMSVMVVGFEIRFTQPWFVEDLTTVWSQVERSEEKKHDKRGIRVWIIYLDNAHPVKLTAVMG
jgi:acyl dehydratase